jgi:Zn finger protein HypA/HybF involved in hydrogenase expression
MTTFCTPQCYNASSMVQLVESPCRLCNSLVPVREMRRHLCPICDEYAQHVALQTNLRLERVLGELQNVPVFRAASRDSH